MKKPSSFFFVISTRKLDSHHPDKELFPDWTYAVPATCHRVVSAVHRLKATDENLAMLRAFVDALEYEYLMMRKNLDVGEVIEE